MGEAGSEKKIKVLQVIGTLCVGGAETVAMNCLRCVDRERYNMDFLVYDQIRSPYTAEAGKLGAKVIRKNVLCHRRHVEQALEEVMKQYGPYDVVHAHLLFHNGYVMSAAVKCGIPKRISMAHSTSDGHGRWSPAACLYRLWMRRKIKRNATDFLACGNKAGAYLYGHDFFENSGRILKNRIRAGAFAYSGRKHEYFRKKLRLGSGRIFLIAGHLIPLKNHRFAFRLFDRLQKKIPECRLIVLGDGALRNELEDFVAKGDMSHKISFAGTVENVNEYMIAADFLLMPSFYEGFPVTLIEAQAAGLMCFVSDRITDETRLTEHIRYLPIDRGTAPWEQAVLQSLRYTRKSGLKAVVSGHFDLSDLGGELDRLYTGP